MVSFLNLRRVSLALGFAALLQGPVFAQELLKPSTEVKPVRIATTAERGTRDWVNASAFIDRLFKKAGLAHTLEFVPGNRSLMYIRSGVIDVEFARFRDYDRVFPDGLRVDPPVYSEKFYVISLSPSITPKTWEEASKYSMAYKSGYKTIELNTMNAARREAVTNDDACLGMVKLKRVEICIGNESQFQDNVQFLTDKELHIARFVDIPFHLWVGPHRPELPNRISKALTDMQKSGELAKYYPPIK